MDRETCYHCGESCQKEAVYFDDKVFCCEGCKTVYDLLKAHQLCDYYDFQSMPGISPDRSVYAGKYDYLDHESVTRQLIRFTDGEQTHVVFYVPNIHCSSCIWLLENLHRLNGEIFRSSVNFLRKEVTVVFDACKLELSGIVMLLAHIGYEPLIHLEDLEQPVRKPAFNKEVIKIGIAGFCFGNSMMLSFPEYFSSGHFSGQQHLGYFFGYLNLFLALPVFFYSASGFFISAWKSIRHRHLNIDGPIALAILVTFLRSVYEITSHTGAGFVDSMTGIVFFMLIGRFFQNKTYDTLSFERDYKSYFPIGVTVKTTDGTTVSLPVSELKKGDHIVIRNNELIPSDAILQSAETHIDYSFITGESAPVKKVAGEFIYAGGRQLDGAAELEVVHPVSQSYLTQLWNKEQNAGDRKSRSFVDPINAWFTACVLLIACSAGAYWLFADSSKALNAFTAVLIVACPCGLLLTTTFANGNMLRIFGRDKCYLKNADVIDRLAKVDTIIFDKTGTITRGSSVEFKGPFPGERKMQLVASLAAQSSHPLSRAIHEHITGMDDLPVDDFVEIPGKGIRGMVDGHYVVLGSAEFVVGSEPGSEFASTRVFLMIDGELNGYFQLMNAYREGLRELIQTLSGQYTLAVLSGDNDSERSRLEQLFGRSTQLLFNQQPEEKRQYVRKLREQGHCVMMIGDGLNDAGALKESDAGIAVSDHTNTFSPACDAILDGSSFGLLPQLIRLAKAGKKIIVVTFVLSLLYNIIGLSFAVRGTLSPVIAAILMPASSISIVLLTTLSTSIAARVSRLTAGNKIGTRKDAGAFVPDVAHT